MKRCHFNKELSAYLDGQLAQNEKIALEEHLKACSDCSQELSHLKQLSGRLKEWQAPELGAFFAQQLKQGLLSEGQEKGRTKMENKRVFTLAPAGALVVMLLFVFITGRIYMRRGLEGKVRETAERIGDEFNPKEHRYARSDTRSSGSAAYSMVPYSRSPSQQDRTWWGHSSSGSAHYSMEPYRPVLRKQVLAGAPKAKAGNMMLASRSEADTFGGRGQYERQYATSSVLESSARTGYEATMGLDEDSGGTLYAKSSSAAPVQITEDVGQVLIVAPVMPVIGEGEKVIRVASVALEVENGKETYKLVERLCVEFKGHIVSTNFYRNDRGQESGKLVLRVPKDSLSAVMDKFNSLGKVENVAVDTKDVSDIYTEISAQLQTAKLVYDKALEALKKRQTTVSDALRTESELTPILMRIEGLKNQLAHLDNDVAYATITMEFHEAALSQKTLQESTKAINESFIKAKLQVVRFFAGIVEMLPTLILILVASIAAIVLGVVVYSIIKKGLLK